VIRRVIDLREGAGGAARRSEEGDAVAIGVGRGRRVAVVETGGRSRIRRDWRVMQRRPGLMLGHLHGLRDGLERGLFVGRIPLVVSIVEGHCFWSVRLGWPLCQCA